MRQKTVTDNGIYVRSHVARDLLQNAAFFRNERLAAWEYVSNGLEYVDDGTNPVVIVTLESKKKRMMVKDNGRGMDWAGLKNFFIMHGENIDRKLGKPGRGRFGTGKSAAFGIGNVLRIRTVQNGSRSQVELRRGDITAMKSEDPIPVRTIESEVETDEPNGTLVEIEDIFLKSLDQKGVIQFIERHLARWRNAYVVVNNHECEFIEPPMGEVRTFKPDVRQREIIGDVELTIKVASAPLDQELRGVSIFSNAVWHETTLAGHEGREMSQYIFGEIDVPRLDEDESPIPPFDASRSMQLNPSNDLVKTIYAFVGQNVDVVRRDLLRAEKERRDSEEAKKLAKQAEAIADVINEDFSEFRQRVARVKAKTGVGFDSHRSEIRGGKGLDELIFGSEVPAEVVDQIGGPGSEGGKRRGGIVPPTLRPRVEIAPPGAEKKGQPSGGKGRRPRTRGGFNVQFKPMGVHESRALYVSEERTIYVNTDHPQLVAAKGHGSIEDPVFQRLAYEVAFSEYAIALAAELNANDEYIDPSDPIVSIRETINRIARKAAHLFST